MPSMKTRLVSGPRSLAAGLPAWPGGGYLGHHQVYVAKLWGQALPFVLWLEGSQRWLGLGRPFGGSMSVPLQLEGFVDNRGAALSPGQGGVLQNQRFAGVSQGLDV